MRDRGRGLAKPKRVVATALVSALLAGVGAAGVSAWTTVSAGATVSQPKSCYPIGTSNCGGTLQLPRFAERGQHLVVRVSGYRAGTPVTIRACRIGVAKVTATSSGVAERTFGVGFQYPLGPCGVTSSGLGYGSTLYMAGTVTIRKNSSRTTLELSWLGVPGRFHVRVYVSPRVDGIAPQGYAKVIAWNRYTKRISTLCKFKLTSDGTNGCQFSLSRGHYLIHAAYGGNYLFQSSQSLRIAQKAR